MHPIDAPRLEARDLTRLHRGRAVVRDVSLDLRAGRVTCLLGPSGCGKSTTLRMLAGVERQDAGTVRMGGRTVAGEGRFAPPEARSVGLMFQDYALFPHLDALGNVAFGLRGPRAARKDRALALLGRVGLADHARRMPHELSGGEQQRVALVRALAPGPSVMLMDEPFSGLDDRLRDAVRDETLDLLRAEGAAVLLVTHEPAEALRLADDIVLMREGRVVQAGTPAELWSRPRDLAAARFFGNVNAVRATVRAGVAETPFGPVRAPGRADGAAVEVAVRPQDVAVHPEPGLGDDAPAVVLRARFCGASTSLRLALGAGPEIEAVMPSICAPAPGDAVRVAVRREAVMVFDAPEADAAPRAAAA